MSILTVTIYGASDDLVEVEWAGKNKPQDYEFDAYGPWRGLVKDPDTGEFLVITAEFSKRNGLTDWTLGVESGSHPFPNWPIQFGERPDRDGDPAIVITVPEGTRVSKIEE